MRWAAPASPPAGAVPLPVALPPAVALAVAFSPAVAFWVSVALSAAVALPASVPLAAVALPAAVPLVAVPFAVRFAPGQSACSASTDHEPNVPVLVAQATHLPRFSICGQLLHSLPCIVALCV